MSWEEIGPRQYMQIPWTVTCRALQVSRKLIPGPPRVVSPPAHMRVRVGADLLPPGSAPSIPANLIAQTAPTVPSVPAVLVVPSVPAVPIVPTPPAPPTNTVIPVVAQGLRSGGAVAASSTGLPQPKLDVKTGLYSGVTVATSASSKDDQSSGGKGAKRKVGTEKKVRVPD